jgi:ketosteroid isomerase-like protein
MSAQDLETIREGIAALNRGDVDGLAATLDPEVELIPLRAVLDGTVYRGHAGMRSWFEDISEDWTRYELELEDLRELTPGRVLVQATMHLRGQSGVALDSPAAWVCDLRGGKVSRVRFFTDSEAALAAAETADQA